MLSTFSIPKDDSNSTLYQIFVFSIVPLSKTISALRCTDGMHPMRQGRLVAGSSAKLGSIRLWWVWRTSPKIAFIGRACLRFRHIQCITKSRGIRSTRALSYRVCRQARRRPGHAYTPQYSFRLSTATPASPRHSRLPRRVLELLLYLRHAVVQLKAASLYWTIWRWHH